jgi:hypothetical protein
MHIKKRAFSLIILFTLTLLSFLLSAQAARFQLVVEEFSCDEGKYVIRFGVVNEYTYERNPTVAFKILQGGKPLACQSISLSVAAGSDGSEIHQVIINAPCGEEDVNLNARLFPRVERNKAGPWLSDCPP